MVGHERQQHAVLERPGLAFVRVTDDDAPARLMDGRLPAELPFAPRCETRPAAPAKTGSQHLSEQRPGAKRNGLAQRLARLERAREQDVAPPHIVGHDEKFLRPSIQRNLIAN